MGDTKQRLELGQKHELRVNREGKILKKKCSECGEIKPIMEFNLTITGKRYQDKCNDCEILALQPKKIPRIVGHGKPLFIEGKAHQTDDLNNHFYENFNKLKEMGDTWLRDEILRKNYGEVKPNTDKTYKPDNGKCKARQRKEGNIGE